MNPSTEQDVSSLPHMTRAQRVVPVALLVFLSPVLTELLMGVVHITNIWLLLPEMAVYGGAALLIREVTRRQQRGWGTILILGIAYALTEECIILQTSLTPQFFSPTGVTSFGWAFGVQWSYLLAMLGYESVYAIVLPIALTEILFPERRDIPWLGRRGLIIAFCVFILGSVGVWWIWSHVGLQRYTSSANQISPLNVVLACIIVLILVVATLSIHPRKHAPREAKRRAWFPWLLGPIAFVFGLFWWLLVAFAYIPASTMHGASPLIPVFFALIWAGLTLLVITSLAVARKGWQDRHRLALIFGALVASMLGGALSIITASPIDKLGKLIFDLIAIALLSYLAWRLRKRHATGTA